MTFLFKIEARIIGKEFQGNAFQNVFYKMVAILLMPQSVIDETPIIKQRYGLKEHTWKFDELS